MERVRRKLATDMPQLTTYFQAGGLVDSVINQGLPAPIDIQVSGNNLNAVIRHRRPDRGAGSRASRMSAMY